MDGCWRSSLVAWEASGFCASGGDWRECRVQSGECGMKSEDKNPDRQTMKNTTHNICLFSRFTFHASRITHHASCLLFLCLPLARRAATNTFAPRNDDKQATFFMGRVKYSSNDGNDCGGVGQDLMKLVSRASTLKIQEERKVKLTDSDLFETPFIFMNGHNDFVSTPAEIKNLIKYLSHDRVSFRSRACTAAKLLHL